MANTENLTIALPTQVVREIDRLQDDRTQFVVEAVQRELLRRRREELHRSLRSPHPDSGWLAEAGFDEWVESLPQDNPSELVDLNSGTPIRWVPERGWVEGIE